jgi:predicted kinase
MAPDPLGEALPADALVLLVGPAGAGKSTWAAANFEDGVILSSDLFRHLLAGDAADQSATGEAFALLHRVARGRLRRGLLSVIDATNLTASARRGLLRLATQTGRPAVAVAFDVPLERCLAQNAARPGRIVPEEVVRRQHRAMAGVLVRLPHEGFAWVHVVGRTGIGPA